jgi:hypothetical protein
MLSAEYRVSRRTLQLHFEKHATVKGSKAAAIAAAVKQEVFDTCLEDIDLIANRARETREAAYRNAVAVEGLIMAQLKLAQDDPAQALRVASSIKMLTLAAGGLERLHTLKQNALGLDKDSVFQEELPVLVMRDLTTEELEKMRAANDDDDHDGADSETAPASGDTDDSFDSDEDNDEIAISGGDHGKVDKQAEAGILPDGSRLCRAALINCAPISRS